MISNEPFTLDSNPASSITQLADYLNITDDGSYVYRGQTRAYPGPLLPSAFRGILGHEPVLKGNHSLMRNRIFGIGKRFLGNYVFDLEDYHSNINRSVVNGMPSVHHQPIPTNTRRDAEAYRNSHYTRMGDKWVESLRLEPLDIVIEASWLTGEFNALAASRGYTAALRAIIERYLPPAISNPSVTKLISEYINNRHRRRFSTDILIGALSYTLGSLVSQQYGFASSALDATTSIDIATFFATHEAPHYHLVPPGGPQAIGAIYRIPRGTSRHSSLDLTSDVYGSQSTVVVHELLSAFESDVARADSLRLLRACFEARHLPEYWERRYDLLRFPRGSVSSSRIGRQQAAIVLPDQIEVFLEDAYLSLGNGEHIKHPNPRIQLSIEDLRSRKGLRCYYFLHSGIDPNPSITASYLWPNQDDFFLLALAYLLAGGFGCYLPDGAYMCPVRTDLITPGFGEIAQDHLLSEARKVLSDEFHSPSFAAPWPCSDNATHLYRVYKAATLVFEGNMTEDRRCLERALLFCREAREHNPSSPILVALELIALKDLGRRHECESIVPIREQEVARQYGKKAHSVTLERFNDICAIQGNPRFAIQLLNWYRTDLEHTRMDKRTYEKECSNNFIQRMARSFAARIRQVFLRHR